MKFKSLTSILMAGMTMSQAFALPDPQVDVSGVTSKISMEGIGPVLGDHKEKNLLYVSPTDMKVIGQYVSTGVVGNCNDLVNFHSNLNGMPLASETQKIYNDKRYYSALFSITAENIRNSDDARAISDLKHEYIRLRSENKHLLAEYESSYQALESVKKELEEARASLKSLFDELTTQLATATSDAERAQIRVDFRERKDAIASAIPGLEQERKITQERFNNALRAWAPYKNELEHITKLEESFSQSHLKNIQARKSFYEDTKKLFDELSNKVVGQASVGYSLNSKDKIELLQKRLMEAGLSYSVQPLQIFNVSINQPTSAGASIQTSETEETVSIGGDVDTSKNIAVGDAKETVKLDAELEVNGEKKQLSWDLKGFSNSAGASGSVEMPITRGTICGTEELITSNYSFTKSDGDKVSATVTYPVYRPASRVVMSKNLPLTFNYYQKAEPLHGVCQMDVSQGSSYVRDHGKKKSGGFFKRKTKSWDHTKLDMKNDMGLKCELTKNPVGANPEQSEEINNAFEKALYQDVFHMFVLAYGKEYKIVPLDKTELGADSRFFSQIGSGVMNLCGKSKMCELSGIVLKSMDELVGSRHSGSSSHTVSSTGTIRKDFRLNSYLISQGSANVELKVCLDKKTCE